MSDNKVRIYYAATETQKDQLNAKGTDWQKATNWAQHEAEKMQKVAKDWKYKADEDRRHREKAETELQEVQRQLKAAPKTWQAPGLLRLTI